jgi:hypothetical protein
MMISTDQTPEEVTVLREWICELLITNQQLRLALMELRSTEARDSESFPRTKPGMNKSWVSMHDRLLRQAEVG